MNKRYLPIGSIVKLKNNNKTLMITGYYSVEYKHDLEIYDYSGCAYPEGVMIKSSYCSFNQSDIARILFEGYKSIEYTKLTDNLNNIDNQILETEPKFFEDKKIELDKIEKNNDEDVYIFPHYEFDQDGIIIK